MRVKSLLPQTPKAHKWLEMPEVSVEAQESPFFLPGTPALSAPASRSLEGRAYPCPWVQQRQPDLVRGDG